MAKKIDQEGIPLHFFGERQRPDRPERVLDYRFVLGDRKIPTELRRLKSRMSVYMYTDGGEKKPKVQIERVKTERRESTWRVDLPILEKGQRVGHSLIGQKAVPEKPEVLLQQTNPKIPVTSHRPPWTDPTFAPKIVSRERFRAMRRIKGSITSFDTDGDSNGGLEIEARGDLTPGNSGGLRFGWWSGDPRLIGVVSGGEEDWSPGFWPWDWADVERGNVIAGGSGFTNLMAWGRTNWPL